MSKYYIVSALWLFVALTTAGCLHTRVRQIHRVPPGDYSRIYSEARIPKSHRGWMINLGWLRFDRESSPSSSYRPIKDVDLSGTQVTVLVSNMSEMSIVVTGWQGGTKQIAPKQEVTVWSGTYPREAPEYPLFGTGSSRHTQLGVQILFEPPLRSANPLVLMMREDAL